MFCLKISDRLEQRNNLPAVPFFIGLAVILSENARVSFTGCRALTVNWIWGNFDIETPLKLEFDAQAAALALVVDDFAHDDFRRKPDSAFVVTLERGI
ncbi:MAG: hypothetical protein U0872_10345 [Planctomycetaceae bacterium]